MELIKNNITCIANQLMYNNMSVAKGVITKLLKNAVNTPVLKSSSTEPSNYIVLFQYQHFF